ncbi:hypothetical protein HDU97_006993 [Phlyctochytrium planicorne]|nr:hypothetical protein HDU97_006993 [Phlyctochytrium planicorne]
MSTETKADLKAEPVILPAVDSKFKDDASSTSGANSTAGLDIEKVDILAPFRNYDPDLKYTEEEERKVITKWDIFVLPWVCIMFFFLQLDRGNIANALTSTFLADLGINIDDNNLGTIIFISAFVLLEIPSNMIIRRVGAHRWIPILMVLWGTVAWATAFIHDRNTFFVARLFLGLTEAGWIPGTLVYLGDFYTRSELGFRLGLFWGTITFATAFAGSLSFAILKYLEGAHGLKGWQWLFLIEGVGTVAWGLLSLAYLPAGPKHTKGGIRFGPWLTETQERIAVARVFRDDPSKGAGQGEHVSVEHIKDAVTDPRLWLHLTAGFFATLPGTPVGGYLPLIISGLGFDRIFSNLLTTPPYLCSMVFMSVLAWNSSRVGERAIHCTIGIGSLLFGTILLSSVPKSVDKWLQYSFVFPTVAGLLPWHGIQAAWISANMGSTGKRTVALAMYIMSVNISSLPGSQIFRNDDAPLFKRGFVIVNICLSIVVVLFASLFFIYRGINSSRERKWNALTAEQKAEYLRTTKDVGNRRLDFRFIH